MPVSVTVLGKFSQGRGLSRILEYYCFRLGSAKNVSGDLKVHVDTYTP